MVPHSGFPHPPPSPQVAHGGGVLRGLDLVSEKWGDTILTGFCVWPAAQVVNFMLVPLRWRVMFFNVVSFGWNSWLAWQVRIHVSSAGGVVAGKVHEMDEMDEMGKADKADLRDAGVVGSGGGTAVT